MFYDTNMYIIYTLLTCNTHTHLYLLTYIKNIPFCILKRPQGRCRSGYIISATRNMGRPYAFIAFNSPVDEGNIHIRIE